MVRATMMVGNKVAHQDLPGGHPQQDGGGDKLLLPHGEHLGADDAHHTHPVGQAHGQDD